MNPAPGPEIAVSGLTRLSTVDWPDRLAAVVFCQGCAWNCPYCQNAGLRAFRPGEQDWDEVLAWLTTRQGLLEAVVFSGGEPTLQPGLGRALAAARDLGFQTGLHTAGMAPAALEAVLPLLDWAGLDLKAPRAAYERITGRAGSADAAWQSLGLLRAGGLDFELRTTWHPALLTADELLDLARELAVLDTGTWALQAFQPKGCEDAALAGTGKAHFPGDLVQGLRNALPPGIRLTLRQ